MLPAIDKHYVAISNALDALTHAQQTLRYAVLVPAHGPVESLAKLSTGRICGEVTKLVAELSQVHQIVTEASRNA